MDTENSNNPKKVFEDFVATNCEDVEVFKQFVALVWNCTYASAASTVRNETVARDLTLRSIANLIKKAQSGTPIKKPVGFLIKMARDEAINWLKSEARRKHREEGFAEQVLSDDSEVADAVRRWLETLDQGSRELVLQRGVDRKTLVEIASQSGSTPDAVRVKWNRIAEKGRQWFQKELALCSKSKS